MNSARSGYKNQEAHKPRHFADFKESKVSKKNMSEELRKKLIQRIELYAQRAARGLPLFKKLKRGLKKLNS